MALSEIDSFVFKFKNLLHCEQNATLSIKSEAGKVNIVLSAELDHNVSAPIPHFRHFKTRNGPSRERRRARRAAARNSEKESGKEASEDKNTEKDEDIAVTINKEGFIKASEEVSLKENDVIVKDEVVTDVEYENLETSVCSVEIFPKSYRELDRLASFRDGVEDYFTNRKDVVKKVLKCEVVDYGNNVRLVCEMNMKRGWIFFFFDQEANYPDLEGVKTIRHSCRDLSNCGGR